jgi:hypothetical protein
MGYISRLLTIIPIGGVICYFLLMAANIYAIFRPATYIPFVYEIQGAKDTQGNPLPGHGPFFEPEKQFQVQVYLTTQSTLTYVEAQQLDEARLWQSPPFTLSDTAPDLDEQIQLNVTLPKQTTEPYQVWAHYFLYPIDNVKSMPPEQWIVSRKAPLIRYQLPIIKEERRLLEATSSEMDTDASAMQSRSPEPHWVPRLDLEVIHDRTVYLARTVPGDIYQYMDWIKYDRKLQYLPVIDADPLVVGPEDLVLLNDTLATQSLTLRLHTTSLGWFRIRRLLWSSLRTLSEPSATESSTVLRLSANDIDKFRLMLVDARPWLLLTTLVASILHILFEWLAFKEDVAHWRRLDNTAGVSKISVMLEAASRCIAVVFLWERRKDTSILFIGSAVLSAAVELWKVQRVMRVRNTILAQATPEGAKDSAENKLAQAEQQSQEVDRRAAKTIGLACIPIAIGYAIWSLLFQEHTGFRAWAIDALMAGAYLLGL